MDLLKRLDKGKSWILDGLLIHTDNKAYKKVDAVFPICEENTRLYYDINVSKSDYVLDLCSGCGIYSLKAAKSSGHVIAIDINPRAIKFGKFNASINDLRHKIDFIVGDLFQPLNNIKFDLIVINPPFEPIPEEMDYFIHSHGGKDGMKIVNRICKEASGFLKENGVLKMVLFSEPPETQLWYKYLEHSFKFVRINKWGKVDRNSYFDYIEMRIASFGSKTKTACLDMPEDVEKLIITASNAE